MRSIQSWVGVTQFLKILGAYWIFISPSYMTGVAHSSTIGVIFHTGSLPIIHQIQIQIQTLVKYEGYSRDWTGSSAKWEIFPMEELTNLVIAYVPPPQVWWIDSCCKHSNSLTLGLDMGNKMDLLLQGHCKYIPLGSIMLYISSDIEILLV